MAKKVPEVEVGKLKLSSWPTSSSELESDLSTMNPS